MKNRTLLLGVIAALPALAQDGWKLTFNTGILKSNMDTPYMVASTYTNGGGPFVNAAKQPMGASMQQLYAEYGNHTPLGLSASYRSGDNEFALEGFSSSKRKPSTVTVSGYAQAPAPLPSMFPLSVDTKLDAMTWDLKWTHHFAQGSHGAFRSTLGFRYAYFKNRINVACAHDPSSPWIFARTESKSDVYGLIAGLGYTYPISNTWSVGADLNLAFVQGDTKAGYALGYGFPDGTSWDVMAIKGTEQNKTATQTDMHVHLDWQVAKQFGMYVGYRFIDYGKVTTFSSDFSYAVGYGSLTQGVERGGGWGMSGFTLGATFRF